MYYYVINPAAGKGAINGMQDKLRDRLRELGIDGEFAKTTGPGDATKMTKQAIQKGYNTIVVVGGDGTVNEVVNGITNGQVAIGIIPIGSSNIVAQRLGITNWQQACEVLAARRLSSYGLIAANHRYFLSTLTLGFETDMDSQMESEPGTGGLKGRIGHFFEARGHAQNYETLQCKITVDDQLEIEAPLFSLSVTNQKFEDPLADNRLLITLMDKPTGQQLRSYLWNFMKNDQYDDGMSHFGAKKVVIETTPATTMMIDGKTSGETPIAIRLTNRQVRFITEKQVASFKPE
jgi:diacylglycerol kinase (ATP)